MTDSNFNNSDPNKFDESLKIDDSCHNDLNQFELYTVFPPDRAFNDHQASYHPDPTSEVPNPGTDSQYARQMDEEEEKQKIMTKTTFKFEGRHLVDTNVVKIQIPPECRDMNEISEPTFSKKRKRKRPEDKMQDPHQDKKTKEAPEKPFECEKCGKPYKKRHELKSHMRKHVNHIFNLLMNRLERNLMSVKNATNASMRNAT
jgi:hypothetical protein